jgi:hypothetical protein
MVLSGLSEVSSLGGDLLPSVISPYRTRLSFHEKPYPWKSPQDDFVTVEKLITDCGYHRRYEELADAKCAIFSEETTAKY